MKKKILIITTLFLTCVTLCSCSIGKKKSENIENPETNVKAEDQIDKGDNKEKNNNNSIAEEDSKNFEGSKENRLVLPEVEVEGYEDTKSGD